MKATSIMKEKIFIKTNRIGFIPQLGIQGPIVNPYPTTRSVAKAMIVSGIQVFEVKPDTKEVIELTLQNVFPGEGDSVKTAPDLPASPKAGVTTDPVKPVDLKGVAAPVKEPIKVDPEPVKVEDAKPEEISGTEKKPELKEDPVAETTQETVSEEATKADESEKKDENQNKGNQNNNNGKKNGKKNK